MVNYLLNLEGSIEGINSISDLKLINSFANSGKEDLSTYYFKDPKILSYAKNCLFQEGIKEKEKKFTHLDKVIILKTYEEKDKTIKDILNKNSLKDKYILQTNEVTINSS
jgi:hypothetical protein